MPRHIFSPALAAALLSVAPLQAQAPGQQTPGRVISLGGSITETVYALGAGERLVGTDQSSVFPAAATELPDVGYFRTLGLEGVLSLRPDLVLALEGSGPDAVLRQLEQAGVTVVRIPADDSPAGALDKVRRVAEALGIPQRGRELAAEIGAELAAARSAAAGLGERPRVLFVWGRGGRTMQVSGRGTAAAAMLDLVHARTAVDAFEGYRPLTPEAVIVARPDVIVVDRGLLEQVGGVDGLLADPALAATPAARNGRIVPVEILSFIGFGPRTGRIALEVIEALHDPVGTH